MLALFAALIGGVFVWMGSSPPPDSPQVRIELAIRALKEGDQDSFDRIRESFANDPQAEDYQHLFQGFRAISEGKWELADEEFSHVNPSGELRSRLLFSRAEVLYRMGRLSEAEWLLQSLLRDDGANLDAHRFLGAIYYDLGSYDLALPHLERVVEREPDSVGTHHLIGLMHRDFERNSEANVHFQAALALDPPEHFRQKLLLELAQSLIAQKEYESALSLAEEADQSVRATALRARCLWNLNRKEESRKLLQASEKYVSDDRLLCLMQLEICMDDQQWKRAVDAATAYLDKDPYDAEIRYHLAQSYARLDRPDDFEREIALFQKNTESANRLTELNIQAIRNPRDPVVRDQLAEICESLGKTELAQMWREAARNCREGLALSSEVDSGFDLTSEP